MIENKPCFGPSEGSSGLPAWLAVLGWSLSAAKWYTYKVLHKLASDPDLVVLSGDKDSSVVIMQRADYVNKLETMIEEGITNGKYMVTEDNTLKDLKSFQDFLYPKLQVISATE